MWGSDIKTGFAWDILMLAPLFAFFHGETLNGKGHSLRGTEVNTFDGKFESLTELEDTTDRYTESIILRIEQGEHENTYSMEGFFVLHLKIKKFDKRTISLASELLFSRQK